MTPRSKKLVALETNNTSTTTPGQPATQRHSTSPSCFRSLGAGEYPLSPQMPDRSPVTPLRLLIRLTGREVLVLMYRKRASAEGEQGSRVCWRAFDTAI